MMFEPKIVLSLLPLLLLAPPALTKPYAGSALRDFSCPEPHGYFKNTNQCDEYVECKNYVPRAYSCPAGLHFNTRAQWIDYPCEHPSRVECIQEPVVPITTTTTTTTTTPRPTTPRPTTPAPVVITPRDISCPQQHGYFEQPDECGEYIECKNYIPRTYACPAGLHFNPRALWIEYPCEQPSIVQCNKEPVVSIPTTSTTTTSTTTTTTPAPTTTEVPAVIAPGDFTCPQPHGYYRMLDQCGEYVECKNYIPRTYACPAGLHFNPRSQWTEYPCQEPSRVKCYQEPAVVLTTTTTTTTTTPAPPTTPAPAVVTPRDFSCPQQHGYFKHSDQCGEYIECKNNIPRTFACPPNLHFNPDVEWTDYPCHHPSRAQCNK